MKCPIVPGEHPGNPDDDFVVLFESAEFSSCGEACRDGLLVALCRHECRYRGEMVTFSEMYALALTAGMSSMVWPRLENGPVSGRTEARVGLIRASDDKNVCELVPGGACGDRQVTGV